jgi:hypothetical protein
VDFDPDRILDQLLEIFVAEHNNWLTFRKLAYRTTGDPSQEYLIAGVVDRHAEHTVFGQPRSIPWLWLLAATVQLPPSPLAACKKRLTFHQPGNP